jgi:vacuolar-type H+-ATPase subunit D/Vma8
MDIKKILWTGLFSCFLTSALLSQTVTDLAKREKERRESLKGKKTAIVTNADLAKIKKKAAYVTAGAEGQTQGQAAGSAGSTASTSNLSSPRQSSSLPIGANDQLSRSSQTASQIMNQQYRTQLEEQYNKAKEYRELLELKMNALQQQFFNMSDMKSKDLIQKDISETYAKLLGAQEVENRAREALEKFLGQSLKDKLSPIWIK